MRTEFKFWYKKSEIWGEAKKRTAWWGWVCLAMGILMIAWVILGSVVAQVSGNAAAASGPMAGLVMAVFFIGYIQARKQKNTFSANLQSRTWISTDDAFWQPLRSFLEL